MGAPRTKAANVEGIAPQRLHQSRIIDLGVVGQCHHSCSRVRPQPFHRLVRPGSQALASREPFRSAEHLARIDNGDVIAGLTRHGCQKLGDMHAAYNKDTARRRLPEYEVPFVLGQKRMLTAIRLCRVLHHPGLGIEPERCRLA